MPVSGITQEELKTYLMEEMGLDGDWTLNELQQRYFNSGLWIKQADQVGLISEAANRTGIVTSSALAPTYIPGLTIVVPPTRRKVQIQWEASYDTSVAGQGAAVTLVYETTNGSATPRQQQKTHTGVTGAITANLCTHMGHKNMGASPLIRVFNLYTLLTREAASSFQCRVLNANLDYNQTRIQAVAL